MKNIFAIALMLTPWVVNAGGRPTGFCVENLTGTLYRISGVDIDNFDWEDVTPGAMNRPDHLFVNYPLSPGDTHCVSLDYNVNSIPYFAMQVSQWDSTAGGVKTRFRVIHANGWFVDGGSSNNAGYNGRIHGAGEVHIGDTGNFFRGYSCPINAHRAHWETCSLFKITR